VSCDFNNNYENVSANFLAFFSPKWCYMIGAYHKGSQSRVESLLCSSKFWNLSVTVGCFFHIVSLKLKTTYWQKLNPNLFVFPIKLVVKEYKEN